MGCRKSLANVGYQKGAERNLKGLEVKGGRDKHEKLPNRISFGEHC